jgi:hypothetical protein
LQVQKSVQDALIRVGGKTLGGKPKYKFEWSADFVYLISNGTNYERVRVVPEDCFILTKFEPAEFWGTEEEWNTNNYESSSEGQEVDGVFVLGAPLLTAGPYPISGRYRVIMSIKRPVKTADGQIYMEHCAPTLRWVEEFFPGVRDFLDLSTQEKADLLAMREKDSKEKLAKSFEDSRKNYKGVATQRQIADKVEKIERFLANPEAVRDAQKLLHQRKQVS